MLVPLGGCSIVVPELELDDDEELLDDDEDELAIDPPVPGQSPDVFGNDSLQAANP
ncbi:MAG: hypothetical protein QM820_48320 [Minicystis sp.]